jgi:hypothetical protein
MSDPELGDLLNAFEIVTREDHPNPARVGCLEHSQLLALAGAPANGASIDEDALKHIARCWPCLQDLKTLRVKARVTKAGQSE